MPFKDRDAKRAHEREASRRYRKNHHDRVKLAKVVKAEAQAWLAIDRPMHDDPDILQQGLTVIAYMEFRQPFPNTYFCYRGRRYNDNFRDTQLDS